MKNKLLWGTLATAAAVCTAKLVYDEIERQADEDSSKTLIENQYVCDTLDGKGLMKWYKEKKNLHTENVVFYLGKATNENAAMLGIGKLPDSLDREHAALQAVVDKDSADVLEQRMITFSKLSPKIKEILDGKEYVIIK